MVEEGPLAVKTGCRSDHITAAYRAELQALALLGGQTDSTTGMKSFRLCVKKHICLNWKMNCNTTVPNPADLALLYANILVSVVLLPHTVHGQEPATGWLLVGVAPPVRCAHTRTHTHTTQHNTTCSSQLHYCSPLIT